MATQNQIEAAVLGEVDAWLADAQKVIATYMAANFTRLDVPQLRIDTGPRYLKIVKTDSQTSVWAFIDRQNGDVLKPAGWKTPAKHARGNLLAGEIVDQKSGDRILDSSRGRACLTAYGPNYLSSAQCATLRREKAR